MTGFWIDPRTVALTVAEPETEGSCGCDERKDEARDTS